MIIRKATHFLAYSKAVVNYIDFYDDESNKELRETALSFIREGLKTENKALCKNHKYELRNLGKQLEEK